MRAPLNHFKRNTLVESVKHFHKQMQQEAGTDSALRVYCHALCRWAEDPNTDPHQAERLLDEIRHASQLENLDDWN